MARAVVDAVLCQHAVHLRHLAACGLGSPARVAALGGGARDARMVRLLASLLGHPVQRCGDDETGARGAALYAAQSQGAAADQLIARCSTMEPEAEHARAHVEFLASYSELCSSRSRFCASVQVSDMNQAQGTNSSVSERPEKLHGLHFSTIVVGAGINGVGTFRDRACRAWTVWWWTRAISPAVPAAHLRA